MEKLITSEHLSNIKFAADCAIKEPDSIYSQEFFMLLDETFGSKGDYESPTQAVAVAWLINRVNELAQRAEAAEAKLAGLNDEAAHERNLRSKFETDCKVLRSKLAELEKQEPMGRVDRGAVSDSNEYPDARVVCLHEHVGWEAFQDGCEIFTRPAPAADRVPEGWKLVPVEPTKQMLEASYREASVYSPTAYRAMLAAAPTPNE